MPIKRSDYLIFLLSGGLFALALAPFFYWPLGLVSLAGFIYAVLTARSAKQAFFFVWLYSVAQFLVGVSWVYVSIQRFGSTPVPLALVLVLAFAAGLALIPASVFWLRHKLLGQSLSWLTIPVFWFLAELLRGHLFTGFPWLFAGDAHLHTWLAGLAPVIGSYGISFVLVLSLTLVWQAWQSRHFYLLALLLVWPLGAYLQSVQWTQPNGELKVTAVQGNIAQDKKWLAEMVSPTLATYYQQSAKHWDSDLILWPETAVTLLYDQFEPFQEDMAEEAIEHNTTIITGIPFRYLRHEPKAGEFHNSIVAFGNGSGLYHKQKLVPFGEFIPFEKQLRGLIPFFDLDMSGFSAGSSRQELLKVSKHSPAEDQLYQIAPFICYEIAYSEQVNAMAKEADLLVTISNDAWFGDSLGPKQHMALAQMRALETDHWLLRATNTGITALVDNKGNIVQRLETNILGTLSATAEMRQGQTPFMRFWVWPLVILSSVICVAAWLLKKHYKAVN